MGKKEDKPVSQMHLNRLNTNRNKELILQQLAQNRGLVTTACKAVGINRATFYLWLQNDPEFSEAYNELKELEVESVKSILDTLITEKNVTATIFYLRNKHPEFKDKLHLDGKVDSEVTLKAVFSDDMIKSIDKT